MLITGGNPRDSLQLLHFMFNFRLNKSSMMHPCQHNRLPISIATALEAALIIMMVVPGFLAAQGVESLDDVYLNTPPLWYRAERPFDNSRHGTPGLDDPSWLTWLSLNQAEQSIELAEFGRADYAMSQLMEFHPNTLSNATALLNRGTIALQRREYGRARFYFNDAIAEASRERTAEAEDIAGSALYSIALAHAEERDQPPDRTAAIIRDMLEQYPGNPKELDALYLLGELIELRGDAGAALDVYDRIIENFPSEGQLEARNRKAHCLLLLGRFAEARDAIDAFGAEFQRIVPAEEYTPEVKDARAENQLLRGELEILEGNFAAAEKAFLPLVADQASSYRRPALLGLGATYQSAGRYDSAVALYGQIIGEDTIDAARMKAEFNRALSLRGLGRTAEATALLKEIGQNAGHLVSDRAQIELGVAAYLRGAYTEADSALTLAIERARTAAAKVRARTLLGVVKLGLNDPAGAIAAFEAADSVTDGAGPGAPQSDRASDATLLRGITLARVQRAAEAITTLNRFLESNPSHPGASQALYWLADSYYQTGLYRAAVDALALLLEQHPGSSYAASALYALGWAQLRRREFAKAESAFSQLAKAFPASDFVAEAQIRRGDALYLAGRFDEAIEAYKRSLDEKPTRDEEIYAEYQIALTENQRGRLPESAMLFESFASCYASDELQQDARYQSGEVLLRAGRYADAVGAFGAFIAAGGRDDLLARAYLALGDAYARLNEADLAEAAYAIVQLRFGESSSAKAARDKQQRLLDERPAEDAERARCGPATRSGLARAAVYHHVARYAEEAAELGALNRSNAGEACLIDIERSVARNRLGLRDTAGAIDALRGVADRASKSGAARDVMLDLGITLVRRGNASEGLVYLQRLHADLGDSVEAGMERRLLLAMASAHEALGALDTSRALLHTVIAKAPESADAGRAWMRLVNMEIDPALRDTARQHLVSIARRDDSIGRTALEMVIAFLIAERNDGAAVPALEDFLNRFGGDYTAQSRALLTLGAIHERLGEREKARAAYARIMRRRCDGDIRSQAAERAARLGQP